MRSSFAVSRAFKVNRVTKALVLASAVALGSFALGLSTQHAQAETGVQVVMNQAKILKLTRDASTIVIGNPDIVDATVQDTRTIVLTGRGFGVTNLVVLDPAGDPVVDEEIFVSRSDSRSLRVWRRSAVQTLSCTPFCEGAYKSTAEAASEAEMAASN